MQAKEFKFEISLGALKAPLKKYDDEDKGLLRKFVKGDRDRIKKLREFFEGFDKRKIADDYVLNKEDLLLLFRGWPDDDNLEVLKKIKELFNNDYLFTLVKKLDKKVALNSEIFVELAKLQDTMLFLQIFSEFIESIKDNNLRAEFTYTVVCILNSKNYADYSNNINFHKDDCISAFSLLYKNGLLIKPIQEVLQTKIDSFRACSTIINQLNRSGLLIQDHLEMLLNKNMIILVSNFLYQIGQSRENLFDINMIQLIEKASDNILDFCLGLFGVASLLIDKDDLKILLSLETGPASQIMRINKILSGAKSFNGDILKLLLIKAEGNESSPLSTIIQILDFLDSKHINQILFDSDDIIKLLESERDLYEIYSGITALHSDNILHSGTWDIVCSQKISKPLKKLLIKLPAEDNDLQENVKWDNLAALTPSDLSGIDKIVELLIKDNSFEQKDLIKNINKLLLIKPVYYPQVQQTISNLQNAKFLNQENLEKLFLKVSSKLEIAPDLTNVRMKSDKNGTWTQFSTKDASLKFYTKEGAEETLFKNDTIKIMKGYKSSKQDSSIEYHVKEISNKEPKLLKREIKYCEFFSKKSLHFNDAKKNNSFLVTDGKEGKTLDRVDKDLLKSLSVEQRIKVLLEPLSSMKRWHEANRVYRNIAPENCLINIDAEKLSLSFINMGASGKMKEKTIPLVANSLFMDPQCKTTNFKNYNDMYSFGLIVSSLFPELEKLELTALTIQQQAIIHLINSMKDPVFEARCTGEIAHKYCEALLKNFKELTQESLDEIVLITLKNPESTAADILCGRSAVPMYELSMK